VARPAGDPAARRAGGGVGGPAGIAKIPGDELAFEFQSDDEEEDGQQSVGGPSAQTQVQMQAVIIAAHPKIIECVIGIRPR
jgi:hypothetical protein